jgi:hypothetical protein
MEYQNSILESAFNVEIDSAAASITVRAVGATKRFVVYALFVQAEGAGALQFQSGSTDLSGPIDFTAGQEEFFNPPVLLFRGVDAGDDFVIANAGTVQVNGWALMGEIDA